MIDALAWLAVSLTVAHSYRRRHRWVGTGKDHRAELPAMGFGMAMLVVLVMLAGVA